MNETGYKGKSHFLTEVIRSAYSTMRIYKNVFSDCYKVQEPNPDNNKFFKVLSISLDEFRKYLRSGK